MIRYTSHGLIGFFHELGAAWIFFFKVMKTFFRTEGNMKPVMSQVASISIRSLPTVIFSGLFVGAILVLQFNLILEKYDAQSFLGGMNTSAVVREVGPLIISFLLAGKIGAYTAAELGTMRVTEQIDAIECLGTDPVQYLIVPRFIGIMISSILLLAVGLLISIVGSMAIAEWMCGINFLEFSSSIPHFTSLGTVLAGLFKALVYGTVVAVVSCYKGFSATGGARGVGKAVTESAVYINFFVTITSFCTSYLLQIISVLSQFLLEGHR